MGPAANISNKAHSGAIAYTPPGSARPLTSTSPVGLVPTQIRHAYGMDQVMFGTVQGNGAGQTIAIIDAYDSPTVQADLQQFDATFSLPAPPSFLRVAQNGSTTYPTTDPGGKGNSWELETALDVEWSHVMAPQANLLLVEANDAGFTNLVQNAVNWARSQPGVCAITMSFGGNEFAHPTSEKTFDTYFTTPSGHAGVTFLASTGDNGSPGGYPAYSPNVVAVGGTTLLNVDAAGDYAGENGWSGSGGGISSVESQPSYQTGVVTQSSTKRTIPDVSMDADLASGVAVYDSYDFGSAPWVQVGGTSLSSPLWAGVIAVADQARGRAGLSSMDGRTQTLPNLYSIPASDFHDIINGNNGGFSAAAGYDLVTGRGTPILNKLIYDLAGVPASVTVNGTAANDTVYLKQVGTTLNEWINAATPGQGTPTHTDSLATVASLAIKGAGGNDNIIIDETGADILAIPTSVSNAAGTVSLELIGSPNADNVFIHGDTNFIAFNSDTLNFSNVTALTFWDTAGGDTVEVAAASIPTTLDLTDNDNIIIDSGNVLINIQPAGTQPTIAVTSSSPTPTSTDTSGGTTDSSGSTTTSSSPKNLRPSKRHNSIFSDVTVLLEQVPALA